MLSKLSRFFERHLSSTDDAVSSSPSSFSQKQLAVAALLVEVAHADHHFSAAELDHLPHLLKQKFALTDSQVEELVDIARSQSADATSLHQFTRWINRECSDAEKIALMLSMWEIAYIDGTLDKYEEYVIRKVADLIYVSHSDFLRTRNQIRNSQSN